MKLKKLAAVLGLGLVSAAAQAGVQSVWRFQDDSIDFILRANQAGGYDLVTSGPVQINDIFVGIFEMNNVSSIPVGSTTGTQLIPAGKELTGVSAVQLVGTQTGGDPSNPASGNWIFSAVTGGMNSILALAGAGAPTVIGGNPGGGAVAAMWLNNGSRFNDGNTSPAVTDRDLVLDAADPTWGVTTNCTSLADCLKEASLGSLFQVDGLWGVDRNDRADPDNYWIADPIDLAFPGGITYDTVKNGAETERYGQFFAGLSNLFNIVEPVYWETVVGTTPCPGGYIADNCVQVKVSGDILGGAGLVNGAVARDDIDARKRVPEPATLGLLGLGLLGLSLLRRRQA